MVALVASVNFQTLLSPRAQITFEGFVSDTYKLQCAGWKIAAEEDIMENRFRLYLENSFLKLTGISDYIRFDYYQRMKNNRSLMNDDIPMIYIKRVSSKIEVLRLSEYQRAFNEIDARPTWANASMDNFEDLRIFNTNKSMSNVEELVVAPQDVMTLLEQIHKIQSKDQAIIREKLRRKEAREALVPQTVARIVTLDEYRKAA